MSEEIACQRLRSGKKPTDAAEEAKKESFTSKYANNKKGKGAKNKSNTKKGGK
jgi:hypothetical protein